MIEKANIVAKPVVTATQMLESMIKGTSLPVCFTSSFPAGEVVPMPTLPLLAIVIFGAEVIAKFNTPLLD